MILLPSRASLMDLKSKYMIIFFDGADASYIPIFTMTRADFGSCLGYELL